MPKESTSCSTFALGALKWHTRKFVDEPIQTKLNRGWRAELVGRPIENLLAGRESISIDDPWSEHPLAFDAVDR